MPARTYTTDVYLACPRPEWKGREVRITSRKFRNLSRLPPPACDQAVHISCVDRRRHHEVAPNVSGPPGVAPPDGPGIPLTESEIPVSKSTILAESQITPSPHETVTVELVRTGRHPGVRPGLLAAAAERH